MDKRAETYRKKSAECERMAQAAADAAIRQAYLDLAYQWREIAEQADLMARTLKNPAD